MRPGIGITVSWWHRSASSPTAGAVSPRRQYADGFQTGQRLEEGPLSAALGILGIALEQHVEGTLRGHVHLGADVADADDELFTHSRSAIAASSTLAASNPESLNHDGVGVYASQRGDRFPDGLGDERDDRVSQAQQVLEDADEGVAGSALLGPEPLVSTGLVSSRYQSQNWFQINSYNTPAAISKR